jgi:hypothetical protein
MPAVQDVNERLEAIELALYEMRGLVVPGASHDDRAWIRHLARDIREASDWIVLEMNPYEGEIERE